MAGGPQRRAPRRGAAPLEHGGVALGRGGCRAAGTPRRGRTQRRHHLFMEVRPGRAGGAGKILPPPRPFPGNGEIRGVVAAGAGWGGSVQICVLRLKSPRCNRRSRWDAASRGIWAAGEVTPCHSLSPHRLCHRDPSCCPPAGPSAAPLRIAPQPGHVRRDGATVSPRWRAAPAP